MCVTHTAHAAHGRRPVDDYTRQDMSKRKRQSLGQAMGQAIVGFDYQVFRTGKPPAELVEAAQPDAPVPAAGGGFLSVDLPDPIPAAALDDGAGEPTR